MPQCGGRFLIFCAAAGEESSVARGIVFPARLSFGYNSLSSRGKKARQGAFTMSEEHQLITAGEEFLAFALLAGVAIPAAFTGFCGAVGFTVWALEILS